MHLDVLGEIKVITHKQRHSESEITNRSVHLIGNFFIIRHRVTHAVKHRGAIMIEHRSGNRIAVPHSSSERVVEHRQSRLKIEVGPQGDIVHSTCEETGLIIPAGRWMMREAMGKCSEIRKVLPEFRLSINISQVQASKSDVIQDISAEMKRAGLPLEALIVELTESDLLEQNINEKHFLTELGRMGISLALDDFGTGYSNFHYLSELKPEIIKIDRSFTVKAVADEQEYYLLNQFCTMIHNLDMRICIEGVENEQEWAMIRKLYPEFTQGYFWGKPCEYEEFMRKFTESRL